MDEPNETEWNVIDLNREKEKVNTLLSLHSSSMAGKVQYCTRMC